MLFSFKYLFPLIATQLVPLFSGERRKAASDNCRVCMYLRAELSVLVICFSCMFGHMKELLKEAI